MSLTNRKKGPKIDLTGRQINYFNVIGWEFNENRNCNMWLCECDCGNLSFQTSYELTSGRHKSCGCKSFELKSKAKFEDLSGQKIGRLLILERVDGIFRTPQGISQIKYRCLCDCGNIVEVFSGNLRKKNTLSCGCLNRELTSKRECIDITGQTFYLLTAIKRVDDYVSPAGNKAARWLCKCECGNYVVVNSNSLRRGLTKSCGCIRDSLGEHIIVEYLKENNIQSKQEYKFYDLVTENGYCMRFDFAIFNDQQLLCLIEFQGPQHYKAFLYNSKDFGKYQREVSDPAKKEYCHRHKIPLYEIRYDDNIQEKIQEIITKVKANMSTPCQAPQGEGVTIIP